MQKQVKPRLTELSKGAGCGCKMPPEHLEQILSELDDQSSFDNLLVGTDARDDAAVMDLGDGTALISTTDFFTPIVDDPKDFGTIAAVNAINDVYAMGGKPMMALAILCWPVEVLGTEMAGEVLAGASEVCKDLGIPLAGGHSINTSEPVFGLSVTGKVPVNHIKSNGNAVHGDIIYLTKPLGTGIVATAQKRGVAKPDHIEVITQLMKKSNEIGADFGSDNHVHAMTDVTGFGLAGHLIEMCEAADLSAELEFSSIPLLPDGILDEYLAQFIVPDNTYRNFRGYGSKISELDAKQMQILCDPQTSGGLLIAVDQVHSDQFEAQYAGDTQLWKIGHFVKRGEKAVIVA